jgi:hypothetical protein
VFSDVFISWYSDCSYFVKVSEFGRSQGFWIQTRCPILETVGV